MDQRPQESDGRRAAGPEPHFHTHEVLISGANANETQHFALALVRELSAAHTVGYALTGNMDSGESGPPAFVRYTQRGNAVTLTARTADAVAARTLFASCDLVVAVGYDEWPMPRVQVQGPKHSPPPERRVEHEASPIVATIHEDRQVCSVAAEVISYLTAQERARPLHGLVLAGGKSTRMGRDKALLEYHGRPQVDVACDWLRPLCEQVFVSCRRDQWPGANVNHRYIHDRILDIGPMGGILSAMWAHPEAAWLVLACDLPFVDPVTLKTLVKHRHLLKMATAFRSTHDGLPEPLCAIYERDARHRLLSFLAQNVQCPRRALIWSNTYLLDLPSRSALDNVNDPTEYRDAIAACGKRQNV